MGAGRVLDGLVEVGFPDRQRNRSRGLLVLVRFRKAKLGQVDSAGGRIHVVQALEEGSDMLPAVVQPVHAWFGEFAYTPAVGGRVV